MTLQTRLEKLEAQHAGPDVIELWIVDDGRVTARFTELLQSNRSRARELHHGAACSTMFT